MNSNRLKFSMPEKAKDQKSRVDEDILNRLKSHLFGNEDEMKKNFDIHINKKKENVKFVRFSPNNEIISGHKLKSVRSELKQIKLPKLEVDDDLIQIFSENFEQFHNALKAVLEGNRSQMNEENPLKEKICSLVRDYVVIDKSRMEEQLKIYKDLINRDSSYQNHIEYLQTYIIIYIFFEYFVIYSNDIIHLLNIREEFIKYCLSGDLNRLSLVSGIPDQSDIMTTLFEKITVAVKICDFDKLVILCEMASENFQKGKDLTFQNCYLDLKNIFNCFTTIFRGYKTLLDNKANLNEKYKNELVKKNKKKIKECRDCIDDVRKPGINNRIEEVLRFVDFLLNIVSGNSNAIKKTSTNLYQRILMYVYFIAIDDNDKSELNISLDSNQDRLKELREFMLQSDNDDDFYILNSALTDEPFIFTQNIKSSFPMYIYFQFCTYLYHLELFPPEAKYDDISHEFMECLMTRDFPLNLNLHYFNFLSSDPRTENMILDFFSHKWIGSLFRKAQTENYSDIDSLLKEINNAVDLIKNYPNSKRIELSIYYYCAMKFYDARQFDLGVKYIYKEMGDKVLYQFFANKIVEQFLNLEDKDLIYSESNEKENYFDTLQKIDKNVLNQLTDLKFIIKYQGILNLYEHLRNGKNYFTDIKIKKKIAKFFNFAFVQNKCPKLLFIRTAGLFQRLFSDFKDFFRGLTVDEVNSASININEHIIKFEIKKFLDKLKKNREYSGYNEKSIEDSYQNIDQNLNNAIEFFFNLENYLILLN